MGWFTSQQDLDAEAIEQFLHPTRHLAKALEKHASGLRLSLYGLLLMVAGLISLAGLLVAPLLNLPGNLLGRVFGLGVMLAIIGSFVNIWGKYRCFEFPIPLSGRWLLSVAVWCDGIMLTTRFVSRMIPLLKAARFAEPLLFLVSLVFFLLFLRSLADVIHRADLKRSVLYVLVSLGVATLAVIALVGISVALKAKVPDMKIPALAATATGLLSITLTVGLYGRLLWQMSHGLADFAKYLRAAEDNLDNEDEAEKNLDEES